MVVPVFSVHESLHELVCSPLVALELVVVVELHVVYHRWQQVVAEVACLELGELTEEQVAHAVESLSRHRLAEEDELRVFVHSVAECCGILAFHLLVHVEVEDSRHAV